MKALRNALIASVFLTAAFTLSACPKPEKEQVPSPPPEKRADLGEIETSPKTLSPLAFLDESLAAVSREIFFTMEGRMIKGASYYGATGKVLFLSVPFDLERTDERAGPLYLVDTADVTQVFQLKDAELVISLIPAEFGGFIYHKLIAQEPSEAVSGETQSLVPHEPSAGFTLQARLLKSDGADTALLKDNMLIADSFSDGRLLAGEIVGVTPFLDRYGVGDPRSWTLFSAEGDAQIEFDYCPVLSPDCSVALDIVRHYDTENYEESVFAIYSGEPDKSVADLSLLFSSPYFITLEEERWDPVACFVGGSSLLVNRFVPVTTAESVVPNTSGRLSLEILDVTDRTVNVLMQLASPYVTVLPVPGSPVIFWLSRKQGSAERSITVGATAIDGSKQRVLAEGLTAQDIVLVDVDFTKGKLLLVECYPTGYSVLKELVLTEAPAPDAQNPEPPSEANAASEGAEVQEPESVPPPINLPVQGT